MRKAIVVIVIVLVVSAIYSYRHFTRDTIRKIKTVKIKRGDISQYVRATGRVESINETIIRTKLEGMIKKIFVEEGDKIIKGDLLAVYDDDFYQNKYTKAQISLKETESRLRNAEKKTSVSERIKYDPLEYELALKAKQTDHEAASINYRTAKREYDAAEELLKSKIMSRLTVEKRRDEFEKSEALLAQAKMNLEDAKKLFERREQTELNILSMETERQQIALERKKAIEEVRYWKAQIEKLNIIAPHNGVVINKAIEDGMLLDAGMEIVTIADVENLRIVAEVDEVDAGRINIGMPGVVTFDAFPNKEFDVEVVETAPRAIVKDDRTIVEAKLKLLRPTRKLKINNQVEAKIILQKKQNVLLAPLESLSSIDNNYSVWKVHSNRLKNVPIKTGISDDLFIEVISGLNEGDKVALPDLKPFQEDEIVEPVIKE